MSRKTDDILIKVNRADEHIADLHSEIRTFNLNNPYEIGPKRNPQTRNLIYYISKCDPVPVKIPAIVGDVLSNLRDPLDHLAYALFMAGQDGQSGTPACHVSFPIFDSAAKYVAESPRKMNGMPQAAVDAINAIKPYKGGNDLLWALHQLNNMQKHRYVHIAASAFHSMDIAADVWQLFSKAFPDIIPAKSTTSLPQAFVRPTDNLFPLKIGDELFVGGPDDEPNDKMQFRIEVVFGESGIIEGKPVLETLHHMADLVRNLILQFSSMLI